MHEAAFRKVTSISGGAKLLSEVNEFLAAVKTDSSRPFQTTPIVTPHRLL